MSLSYETFDLLTCAHAELFKKIICRVKSARAWCIYTPCLSYCTHWFPPKPSTLGSPSIQQRSREGGGEGWHAETHLLKLIQRVNLAWTRDNTIGTLFPLRGKNGAAQRGREGESGKLPRWGQLHMQHWMHTLKPIMWFPMGTLCGGTRFLL